MGKTWEACMATRRYKAHRVQCEWNHSKLLRDAND